MKREVLIYNKTNRKVPKKFISDVILKALEFIKLKQPVELAVLIVSAEEIGKLNKIWRHKNYIPEELSFGLNSRKVTKLAKEQNKMLELGEVVVNVDKISDKNNLAEILIHSLLHLLGYDHEKSRTEALKMEQLEKRILKYLRAFSKIWNKF